jgi:hypothetical protein
VNKAAGATVGTPVMASRTHHEITVYAITPPANGQTVQYAIHTTNDANASTLTWQNDTLFGSLPANSTYFVYARSAENMNFHAGAPSVSAVITTLPAPDHSILLSEFGTHVFSEAPMGYDQQIPLSVTITNTGNQPTGALTIALSGTNASSFTLSETSMPTIAAGDTNNFTVVPNDSLTIGTYTAIVTVNGDSGIYGYFNVSFTVNRANGSAVTTPVMASVTHNSITVYRATLTTNTGQAVQYAIDTTDNADPSTLTWQNDTTFGDLTDSTNYFVYARSVENTNFHVGTPSVSAVITTLATPTTILSIKENITLNVYPNPVFDGRLIVEIPDGTVHTQIHVYDLLGRLVLTRPINRPITEIDISHLPDGTYIVRVEYRSVKIVKR